jgi:hypothetical protein
VTNTKVVIEAESRAFYINPEFGHAIWDFVTHRMLSEDTHLPDRSGPGMIDGADPEEINTAVKDLLPHVEVLGVVGETCYGDNPFTRGGWPMYQAGVLSSEEPPSRLTRPEGRLMFATSDLAVFWQSFIDGAIESGIRAGHQVRDTLQGDALATA